MAADLDPKNDEFRSLCTAIGFVVLNWAVIEQQVDNWVNVAFINCGGKSLRKKSDIPRSLSQKLDFLNECFGKLAPLKPFAGEGRSLVGRVSNLSDQRNDLIHGGIVSLEPENGAYRFRKIKYMKENHAVTTFMFDPAAFDKLGKDLGNLLTEQIAFSQKLADKFLA